MPSVADAVAVSGSPPTYNPPGSVVSWIFSNPFTAGAPALKSAPSAATAAHSVPPVPRSTPFLHDLATGAVLDLQTAQDDAQSWANGLLELLYGRDARRDAAFVQLEGGARLSSDIVLIQLPNCVQFAVTLFGTWKAGLAATLASPSLTANELAWIVQTAKPTVIVTTTAHRNILHDALKQQQDQTHVRRIRSYFVDLPKDPYCRSSAPADDTALTDDWKTLFRSETASVAGLQPASNDAAVILWSSGTSGRSKGVVLSHGAINAGVLRVWHSNPVYGQREQWLGFVPFCHIFGLSALFLVAPCCGATIHMLQPFNPFRMLDAVAEHNVTALHMAPPVAVFLAKEPSVTKDKLASVRSVLCGGAPCSQEIVDAVYKRLDLWVRLGYGLSEATAVCEERGASYEAERAQSLGCVGRPLFGVELQITSTDDPRKTLQIGEEGEILIRSPSNLSYYLNNPQATSESFHNEWFRTGDVGKLDSQGKLYITDRLKEMIKVKGFQVSPSDLENVLCASSLVRDAAVTSVFDESQATELPKAYVVPKDEKLLALLSEGGTDEAADAFEEQGQAIKAWVEGRASKQKWLRGNVVFVKTIPRSPNGKTLRRLLKDTKGREVMLYRVAAHARL